jgi:hypothetical protein
MGEMRGIYKILIGKWEQRRPLGRPSLRWENNIMDLTVTGCEGLPAFNAV